MGKQRRSYRPRPRDDFFPTSESSRCQSPPWEILFSAQAHRENQFQVPNPDIANHTTARHPVSGSRLTTPSRCAVSAGDSPEDDTLSVLSLLIDEVSVVASSTSHSSDGEAPAPDQPYHATPIGRSSHFWFPDGSVVMHVGDTLYKLHRSILERHSADLKTLLAVHPILPSGNPFTISGISSRDFECLLLFLYPLDYAKTRSFTLDELGSIFKAATDLGFTSIREFAVTELSRTASDIDKVIFGRRHGVNEWLIPSLHTLCEREEALTLEEGRRLGVDDVIRVASTREHLRAGHSWDVCQTIFELA